MAAGIGPRGKVAAALTHPVTTNIRRAVADILVGRADDDSDSDVDCRKHPNLCEKPAVSSKSTTWIVVGTVVGVVVVATLCVLIFLHMRRRKRDRAEDMDERYQRSDYGLDEMPGHGKPRPDVSPSGYGRRSRDPLQVGTEPKYPGAGGQLNGHLDPFGVDDAPPRKTDSAPAYSPSVDPQWPKRESSQKKQRTPPIAPI